MEVHVKNHIQVQDFKTADGHYVIPTFDIAFSIMLIFGEDIGKRYGIDPVCTRIMKSFRSYRMYKNQLSLTILLSSLGEYLDHLEFSDSIKKASNVGEVSSKLQ